MDATLENLRAFAKLYGYVRFFHPSDEAAETDWDALAVHGAGRVKAAADPHALRAALLEVFLPLAPTLRIGIGAAPEGADSAERGGDRRVAWQHYGVRLSDLPNFYESRRSGIDDAEPLFGRLPEFGEATEATLGSELLCHLPLVLPADGVGTRPRAAADALRALRDRLEETDAADVADGDARLGLVVIVWNVFQHFCPYFEEMDGDWEEALVAGLASARDASGVDELVDVLRAMAARTRDGHALLTFTGGKRYAYTRPGARVGRPAVRLEWVEERVAVTAVDEGVPLERGDVVLEMDGEPAERMLRRAERLVAGSDWFRRYRALNYLGTGPLDRAVAFCVERGGERIEVEVARDPGSTSVVFNAVEGCDRPGLERLGDGLFYLSARRIDAETFERSLPDLAAARGVILDCRWGGGGSPNLFELLPHLLREEVESAIWQIPRIVHPDRRDMEFEESRWTMAPKEPRLGGRLAVLIGPAGLSAGETVLAILEHYRLADFVGEPTAGCNGNVNVIPLPFGARLDFTGMRVLKHDRSPHHLVGIRPTHPVTRTLAAIRAGRDEALEAAIALLS